MVLQGWVLILITLVLNLDLRTLVWSLTEASDGSVCFNNCNGHGECFDYSCSCYIGWSGDDCRTSFIDGLNSNQSIIPVLAAGHYNLTRKTAKAHIDKSKVLLVGFSTPACQKCILVEQEYAALTLLLDTLEPPVQFARLDTSLMRSIALEYGANEVPSLVLFQKGRPAMYRGPHTASGVLAFVKKVTGRAITRLDSAEAVRAFTQSDPADQKTMTSREALPHMFVVGFFSAHDGMEEDEYDDFVQAAKLLQTKEDVYFGEVVKKPVARLFMQERLIDRTPSVVLFHPSAGLAPKSLNLDDFLEKVALADWIVLKSTPLVGRLTTHTFPQYDKIGKPMLMLFLDLSEASEAESVVRGRTGGIPNEDLLDELRLAAKEHYERILFVYLDGIEHADKMKSLGLYGGRERLPSLAFNTRDGLELPFPEELPVNSDTLLRFCAEFLSGKLRSALDAKEMAKKALMSVVPMSRKNTAKRQAVRAPPEVVRGISEAWDDGSAGDLGTVLVNATTFSEMLLHNGAEDKDVVLMLHASNCEPCAHFAVYFKRMAMRFADLAIPSLVIARMDVTSEAPPPELNLMVGRLPLIVVLPAGAKHPPWTFYSGLGKVQQMMYWAQQNAAIKFDLPHMPHLSRSEMELFKTQVREREEYMDKEGKKKREAEAAEETRQAEYELSRRRRRKHAVQGEDL